MPPQTNYIWPWYVVKVVVGCTKSDFRYFPPETILKSCGEAVVDGYDR